MKRTGFLVILVFAIAACLVPSLQGQTQSQLTGTISDDTGAVVPNAVVHLRNTTAAACCFPSGMA